MKPVNSIKKEGEREKREDADLFKDIVLEDESLHSVPSCH